MLQFLAFWVNFFVLEYNFRWQLCSLLLQVPGKPVVLSCSEQCGCHFSKVTKLVSLESWLGVTLASPTKQLILLTSRGKWLWIQRLTLLTSTHKQTRSHYGSGIINKPSASLIKEYLWNFDIWSSKALIGRGFKNSIHSKIRIVQ